MYIKMEARIRDYLVIKQATYLNVIRGATQTTRSKAELGLVHKACSE